MPHQDATFSVALPQGNKGGPHRSEAKWRDLLVLFCPPDLAHHKSHHPPLVIPSAAERPAVRPGSRTKVSVPLVLYRIVILRSCDFIDLSREVIEF